MSNTGTAPERWPLPVNGGVAQTLHLGADPLVIGAKAAADPMEATRLVEGDEMGIIALDDGQLRVDKVGGRS